MAGKRPLKLPDGTWKYPNSAAVLDEVGLLKLLPTILACAGSI
jgi:hypothetical protein